MGSDHLMMEADSPRAGARVGSEKVISDEVRCTVSTSPSTSSSLGHTAMVMEKCVIVMKGYL